MSRRAQSKKVSHAGRERRRHARLHVEGVQGGFLFSTNAKIVNLSLDGIALETSEYLQVGRPYSLKLSSDEGTLSLRGRVVWCRMLGTSEADKGERVPLYCAGLHFEDLLSETAHQVHRFLDSNAVVSPETRLFGRFRPRHGETADIDFQASFRVEKISLAGMEIDSDTFVEPDTVLDLEVRIGARRLKIGGRVVHSIRLPPQPGVESASRLGIEFSAMSDETEKTIKNLIRSAIE
jgi:hypothetical protein